jgi:hypothetical protein
MDGVYVKCMVHLPDGQAVTLDVGANSVISDILKTVGFVSDDEFVVFTGAPAVNYSTPFINLANTMGELNMYHTDKNYLAELSVHYKRDTTKYNVELYTMYITMAARDMEKIDSSGGPVGPVENELR